MFKKNGMIKNKACLSEFGMANDYNIKHIERKIHKVWVAHILHRHTSAPN